MRDKLVIGTRGSKLALWQANYISSLISKDYEGEVELKIIKTTGDKILDSPLAKIGDKGLFVKEIETALLNSEVDLAVHSMKDMPTDMPDGLELAGASKREDPRDAFISVKYESLDDMPDDAVVATSSLRRKAQLLHNKPALSMVDIRGNVDTRIKKLSEGAADAMIMAAAGLKRMGLEDQITHTIEPSYMLPAVGQGCIAIQTRKDDNEIKLLVSEFSNENDFVCVRAERALMKTLEGGCQVPIGALARLEEGTLFLEAMVASLDGSLVIRDKKQGDKQAPESLGEELAEALIKQGATKILAQIRQDNVESERDKEI